MTDNETSSILEQLFAKVGEGMDKIISLLRREVLPHPETIVEYSNGSISSFSIEGVLVGNSIPDKTNAVKVDIGTAVTNIAQRAFSGCSGLTSITIPDGTIGIGRAAFSDCTGLTSVTIGNGVTNIEIYAFSGCSSLTAVTIPDSVTRIGSGVFTSCPATVTFEGRDKATVQGMSNFRWSIETNKIVCTDGTL